MLAVAITPHWRKNVKAIHHARPHTIACLLSILFAVVLRNGRENIFDHAAIGVMTKLNRGAFEVRAGFCNRITQIEVLSYATREARDVVDDHDIRAGIVVALQPIQHG
nr:hypothetical protein [Henriciella algicola]